ncbi:MAG TPA: hypothetical protein VF817_02190 [Patescibacteria group bacterium]
MHLIEVAQAGVISSATPVSAVGMNVLYFLLSVIGVFAIIMLVVSAVRYFLAFGNEEEMKSAKLSMQYTVIGIAIAMGTMILLRFVGQFFSKN